MKPREGLLFAASIIVCQAAGIIGSFFTAPAIQAWYPALEKPFFTPPNWFFAPVWTLLFLLMGIALFLALRKGFAGRELAVLAFAAQLALNVLWSALFFGLKSPVLALIEIALLWLSILATIILFRPIDKRASALLLPYIAWVSFAAFLNAAILLMNT